jgi:hypothetical protein
MLFLGLTACNWTASNENPDWTDLISFRMYTHIDKDFLSVGDSELEQMNFIEMGIDEAQFFLNQATPLPNETYIWKGSYLAIAKFKDGQTKRLKISCYGGFFKDLTNNKYYEIKNDSARNGWDKYCSEYNIELHKQILAYKEIAFDKLNIPKSWTEIKNKNSEWLYSIPCHNIRELQTIDIFNMDSPPRVSCNFGTEGQGFVIKKIFSQGDSLCIQTVLPYDTNSVDTFSMIYIDRKSNITRWTTDAGVCTFIPTADTLKYKRMTEPCD